MTLKNICQRSSIIAQNPTCENRTMLCKYEDKLEISSGENILQLWEREKKKQMRAWFWRPKVMMGQDVEVFWICKEDSLSSFFLNSLGNSQNTDVEPVKKKHERAFITWLSVHRNPFPVLTQDLLVVTPVMFSLIPQESVFPLETPHHYPHAQSSPCFSASQEYFCPSLWAWLLFLHPTLTGHHAS